jgi:hypothetical protein
MPANDSRRFVVSRAWPAPTPLRARDHGGT